jgi:hypothetical protein
MPFELTLVRRKDKQAQMMVADLSPPMPVENLQLKLKHKINIKGNDTATLLLSLISTASKVGAPVLSLPIWNIFSPSLLKKLTVIVTGQ